MAEEFDLEKYFADGGRFDGEIRALEEIGIFECVPPTNKARMLGRRDVWVKGKKDPKTDSVVDGKLVKEDRPEVIPFRKFLFEATKDGGQRDFSDSVIYFDGNKNEAMELQDRVDDLASMRWGPEKGNHLVLDRAVLATLPLKGADLRFLSAVGAEFWGCDLDSAVLYRSNLSAASFGGGLFESSHLANLWNFNGRNYASNLSHAELGFALLPLSDLSKANLTGVNAEFARFDGANLSGSYLSGGSFGSARFDPVEVILRRYRDASKVGKLIFAVEPYARANVPSDEPVEMTLNNISWRVPDAEDKSAWLYLTRIHTPVVRTEVRIYDELGGRLDQEGDWGRELLKELDEDIQEKLGWRTGYVVKTDLTDADIGGSDLVGQQGIEYSKGLNGVSLDTSTLVGPALHMRLGPEARKLFEKAKVDYQKVFSS